MANPYDQFDAAGAATPAQNVYDQFDNAQTAPTRYPGEPGGENTPWWAEPGSGFNRAIAEGLDLPSKVLDQAYLTVAHKMFGATDQTTGPFGSGGFNGQPGAFETAARKNIPGIGPLVLPQGPGFIHEALNTAGSYVPATLATMGGAGAAGAIEQTAAKAIPDTIDALGTGEADMFGTGPAAGRGVLRSPASGTRLAVGHLAPRGAGSFAHGVEAGAAAGAGQVAGAEGGHQFGSAIEGTDTPSPWWDYLGGLAGSLSFGGMAPFTPFGAAQIAARPLTRLAKNLYGTIGDTEGNATSVVQKLLKPVMASPRAQANMQSGNDVAAEIPGFNPSLAERSGDVTLVRQQQQLEHEASGTRLQSMAERNLANREAVANYRMKQTPSGGPMSYIIDTARKGVSAMHSTLDMTAQAIANNLPRVKLEKAGAVLQNRLAALKLGVQNSFTDRAKALGLDQTDLTDHFVNFAQKTLDDVQPSAPGDTMDKLRGPLPKVINDIKAQLEEVQAAQDEGKQGPSATFTTLKNLRQRISDAYFEATDGPNPDKAAGRMLAIAKQNLTDTMFKLPMGEEYKQFVSDYFNHYIARFENGAVYRMQQKAGTGFLQTLPEKTASLFISDDRSGGFTQAQQFKTAFGNDPRAFTAFKAAVIDDFRNAVVDKKGYVNEDAARNWINDHQGLIRTYPELRATPQDILERVQENNVMQKQFEDMKLTREMSKLTIGNSTDEAFMKEAIRNPKLGRQLLMAVRDAPDSLGALKRHLFENAPENETLDQYLNSYIVKNALGPTHVKALRTIFKANEMMARVGMPKGQPTDLAPLAEIQRKSGFKIPQWASRTFAVVSGRTSERYVLAEGAVRLFNRLGMERAQALLERSLYDPKLAVDIANHIKLGGAKSFNPIIHFQPWLVQLGLQSPQAKQDETQ